MKDISTIRRTVATMANQLHKLGYTLSKAFKTAWTRVKEGMVVRVSGVTFSNIQERLRFLSQFRPQDLTVSLEREADNSFDTNAIKVRVHIPAIRKQTEIGYIPALVAGELAKAIDIGCEIKATFKGVIGGYATRETFGALLSIAI